MRKFALLLCVTILGVASVTQAQSLKMSERQALIAAQNKYARMLSYVANLYVDTLNIGKLTDKAIVRTLTDLDPHSVYVSKEEFDAMNEPLQGGFDGIGIEFNVLNDTLLVVSPVSGGPSERVGIRAGDRIVAVDGDYISGKDLTTEKVYKYLRGKKGTKVRLAVLRKNVSEELFFEVTRDKIPIFSVDASYEIAPKVAYIRLSRFAISSMDEIYTAFKKFDAPEALILDFRGNGGGIMGAAIDLSDQFLDSGKLIVYTEGARQAKEAAFATSSGFFQKGKLIVLIDEGSASASEIVAGAIQDWDRGIIIGRRSFGKGLVQNQLPLGDGSFMRLTIAHYHTPTGRVIQRPYDSGDTEKYYADLYKRFSRDGEAFSKDSIQFPDSLKYSTLKNHRTVYGGGGIMPDIFVPYDTSGYSAYYTKLIRLGILQQYILSYVDNNRQQMKKQYKTFADFNKNFTISPAMFDNLVTYAEKEKLPKDDKGIETSGDEIKLIMKALIARDLWGSNEYFMVINLSRDDIFDKALEVINNWDHYSKEILHN